MQGMTPKRVSQRKTKLASWLRDGLIKLGPTFIKIGQQFSTRVDVLSPEFIKELEQLQDSVPPFESEAAVSIIERELGAPVDTIYDDFDREPIAAASLGQVFVRPTNQENCTHIWMDISYLPEVLPLNAAECAPAAP